MADRPRFKIRGQVYEYAETTKIGDPALIEQVTGLRHGAWRRRYIEAMQTLLAWQEAKEQGEDPEPPDEDSIVDQGILAMSIARKHRSWSRSQVAEFVADLDWDEVEILGGGDAGPPTAAATTDAPSESPSGTKPAETSKSDSDSDSKQSPSLASFGSPTSPS